VPAKDSADRLGVFGVVDDGTVAREHWEAVASLIGELIVSKAAYGDHITVRRRTTNFSLPAEMRWSLLPPLTFTAPDITIAGLLLPSHGIAGDAFDYAVTDRVASIGIFDAMGHGLEASRMANLAVAPYRNSRRAGLTPVSALHALDEVIASEFGDSRFVTAQLVTLDIDTGRMQIASAGHPPPIRLGEGRAPETVTCPSALPAGLATEPVAVVIDLDEGDTVILSTDGVIDARSPEGQWFGEERLAATIAQAAAAGLPPSEVVRHCVRTVRDHQGDRNGDDATLVMVSWQPQSRQFPRRS
jgi:serine phosphatase RsbU (regulator of sigma subunit)